MDLLTVDDIMEGMFVFNTVYEYYYKMKDVWEVSAPSKTILVTKIL